MTIAAAHPDDDDPVGALLAAISTLSGASREELLRRLVDSLHAERVQDEKLLDPVLQRDVQLVRALRSVSDSLGHAPSTTEYLSAYKLARGRGDDSLPSISSYMKRYRTWKAALFAAGLGASPPHNLIYQRRHLRARPAKYPTARIVDCLRACADDLGRVPSVRDYDAWREQKCRDAVSRGRVRPDFPFFNTVLRRFGGWSQALAAAGLDGRHDRRYPPDWWSPLDKGSPE